MGVVKVVKTTGHIHLLGCREGKKGPDERGIQRKKQRRGKKREHKNVI